MHFGGVQEVIKRNRQGVIKGIIIRSGFFIAIDVFMGFPKLNRDSGFMFSY